MLTDDEETKVRNLTAAVEAAGYDCLNPNSLKDVTATLRIGRITTELSALDAQIQTKAAARDAQNATTEAEIAALRTAQDQKRADLRSLLGAPNP